MITLYDLAFLLMDLDRHGQKATSGGAGMITLLNVAETPMPQGLSQKIAEDALGESLSHLGVEFVGGSALVEETPGLPHVPVVLV